MPKWLRILLGALLGAILGAASMAAWTLQSYSQNIAHAGMGQQDSVAIATGLILMVLVPAGAICGCMAGIVIGWLWPSIQSVYKKMRFNKIPRWIVICVVIIVGLLFVCYRWRKSSETSAKLVLTIPVSSEIVSLEFAPNNLSIATIDMETPIKIRNVRTGKVTSQLQNSRAVRFTKFFPDSKKIAGISDRGTVGIWNTSTGRQIAVLKRHQVLVPERGLVYDAATGQTSRPVTKRKVPAVISTIDISPDEKLLATGSDDKTVEVWNVQNHKRLQVFHAHKSPINEIAFSPDGKSIASVDENGIVMLWNPYSGHITGTIKAGNRSDIQWSSDGKELLGYDAMRNESIWDTKTSILMKTINADERIKEIYPLNPTQMVSSSTHDIRLAICEDDAGLSHQSGGNATIYDVKSGATLYSFATAKPNYADLSADGKLLAVGGVEYNQRFKNGYRKVIQFWSVP